MNREQELDRICDLIRSFRVDIINTVDPGDLFPSLRSQLVLDEDDCERIGLQGTRRTRANFMLDMLERKTNGMIHFIHSLEEKYGDLHSRVVCAYMQREPKREPFNIVEHALAEKNRRLEAALVELEGRETERARLEQRVQQLVDTNAALEQQLESRVTDFEDDDYDYGGFRELAEERAHQLAEKDDRLREKDKRIREQEDELTTLRSKVKRYEARLQRADVSRRSSSSNEPSLFSLRSSRSVTSVRSLTVGNEYFYPTYFTPPLSRKLSTSSCLSVDRFRDLALTASSNDALAWMRSWLSAKGKRVLDIKRFSGRPCIALMGGLHNGIFVSWVDESLPVYVKKRLKVGDKILKLNGIDFTSVTLEDAHAFLVGSSEVLRLEVIEERELYEAVMKMPDEAESFYVQVLFSHESTSPAVDFSFQQGDVFKVIRSLVLEREGMWKAKALDKAGNEMHPPKYIPNGANAKRLQDVFKSKDKKQGSLPRKKISREKMTREMSVESPTDDGEDSRFRIFSHQGYMIVTKCKVGYARPVVLLGLGVRQVIEELVQSEDKIAKKFVRCPVIPNDSKFAKATQDLIELEAHENDHHCLIDNDLHIMDKLDDIHVHPVVIVIRRGSSGRTFGKGHFLSSIPKQEYENQLKIVKEALKLPEKVISEIEVDPPTKSLDEIVLSVCAIVKQRQQYAVWESWNGTLAGTRDG